jgi:hypothetical protein
VSGHIYFQLGMEVRSLHRSQSVGQLQGLEGRPVGLRRELPPVEGPDSLFAGIDTHLTALDHLLPAGGEQERLGALLEDVENAVGAARRALGPGHLGDVVAPLADALRALDAASALAGAPTMSGDGARARSIPRREAGDRQRGARHRRGHRPRCHGRPARRRPRRNAQGHDAAARRRRGAGARPLAHPREPGRVVGAGVGELAPAAASAPRARTGSGDAAAGSGASSPPAAATPGSPATNGGAALAPMVAPSSMPAAVTPPPEPVEAPVEEPPMVEAPVVAPGDLLALPSQLTVDPLAAPSVPYFLRNARRGDLYDWEGVPAELRGEPFEPPALVLRAVLELVGVAADAAPHGAGDEPLTLTLTREVVAVDRSLTRGEVRRPLRAVPAIEVSVAQHMLPWALADAKPRELHVTLEAHEAVQGQIDVAVPEGWPAVAPAPFQLPAGERRTFELPLAPPPSLAAGKSAVEVAAVNAADSRRYAASYPLVDYEHIRPRPIPTPSTVAISAFPLELPKLGKVGYVRGAADAEPEALAAVGVPVEVLAPAELPTRSLDGFDAVIIGPRAYDAPPRSAPPTDGSSTTCAAAVCSSSSRSAPSTSPARWLRSSSRCRAAMRRASPTRRRPCGCSSPTTRSSRRRIRLAKATGADGCRSAASTSRSSGIRPTCRCSP